MSDDTHDGHDSGPEGEEWFVGDDWKSRKPGAGRPRMKPGTGRNSPCPCGSGKKYKHCCSDAETDRAATSSSWFWFWFVLLVAGVFGLLSMLN